MRVAPACNVTKRQLMPSPRLSRHLRPCRCLWSVHQVRFASTGGGDGLNGAQTEPAVTSAAKTRTHSRNGRWRRDAEAMQPADGDVPQREGSLEPSNASTSQLRAHPVASSAPPSVFRPEKFRRSNSVRDATSKSPAQRQREALGTGPAITKIPMLALRKHVYPRDAHDPNHPARIRSEITSSMTEKEELEKQQQAGTSADTEEGLLAKLKKLEEQVELLQKKLEHETDLEEQVALLQKKLEGGAPSVGSTGAPPAAEHQSTPPTEHAPVTEAVKDHDTVKEHHPVKEGQTSDDSTLPAARRRRKGVEVNNTATLAQQIQAQSSSMRSSSHQQPVRLTSTPTASDEVSDQSLLDELFPEVSNVRPDVPDQRPSYPKLELPASDTNPHIRLTPSDTRTDREKAIEAFQKSGEQTTVLQLSNCSTALTEADFRRLIPKGLHIESWSRDGEFYKIIPGRDPLSLERLPFYYLLFRTPASALAYQKNAARISKLTALHQPTGIHSAIPPPRGFLEDGEDIQALTSSFVLHPSNHVLDLRVVMQPYNPALRALISAGGYAPIEPSTTSSGQKISRVLLHIDGYEPSHWDLWQILLRHAHAHGIIWPFRNDHSSALRRLRDFDLNARAKLQATSTANPRAAHARPHEEEPVRGEEQNPAQMNQLVMNRVYNRWIVEFEDATSAKRFAIMWHRVVLPDAREGKGAWRETEERRWVSAEFLW